MLLHDTEESDDDLGGRSDEHLEHGTRDIASGQGGAEERRREKGTRGRKGRSALIVSSSPSAARSLQPLLVPERPTAATYPIDLKAKRT